ncbi:HNH endonuclease [Vibrio phage Phriendly]|nr:HNH endonuclease [Vibrio phage Phriendly]
MICEFCNKHFEVNSKGSGGTNRAMCFDCMPEGLDKNARRKVRQDLLNTKARTEKLLLGCSECGYKKNPSALEWHHPEDDKLMHPSNALKGSWAKYKAETDKCILLCANCHREVHFPC